ncbi:MAG: methyl-accepting chemotaxis protein [Magnetococcales bacterium]|nr:methyl-accepting chemotaxis protein [Magnetococcales bacterium]
MSNINIIDWLTSGIGPVFLGLVDPLLGWFRQEDVAPTIATAMMAYAIYRLFKHYLLTVFPALNVLRRPIRFLSGIKDRDEFAQRFNEFDALMTHKGFLKHSWMEFSETLMSRESVVEICVRPSVFLNAADAEHDGLRIKSLSSLGGIFISLGLLFTFIGLVAALSLASGTIKQVVANAGTLVDGATAEVQAKLIQQALAELLKTASFKFWTSIAGLLCGIVLGIGERFAMHLVTAQFDELNRHLERVTLTVTPEILADRTYREIRDQSTHLREFTGQFRTNITEALQNALINAMPPVMTDSVSHALTDRMPSVMSDAMTPVVTTLESMTNRLTSMNEDAIRKMTGDFGSVISQSAGSEIRAVAETLSSMPAQIADAAGEMRNAAAALTEGMHRITETADKNVDSTHQKLDAQLEATVRGLSDAAQAVKETMEHAGDAMLHSGKQAGTAFGGEIAEAVKRIEQATNNNAQAIELVVDKLVKATTGVTGEMSAESSRTMYALRDVVEQMSRTVADVAGNLERGAVRSADDVTERFLSSATAMQEAVNRNSEQIATAVQSIIDAGRQAENGVGKAAEDVGKTMSEKGKEAAEQVVVGSFEVLTNFRETVDKLWLKIDELGGALRTVEQRIGIHATALENTTRAARDTETAMTGSARALTTASEPLTRTGELMSRSLASITTVVGTAVSGLTDSQRETARLAEELKKTGQELQMIWARHVGRFDGVDAGIETVFRRVITSTDEHARKLTDYIGKIDSHVEKIVGHLSGNVDELQSTVDAMTDLAKTMRGS